MREILLTINLHGLKQVLLNEWVRTPAELIEGKIGVGLSKDWFIFREFIETGSICWERYEGFKNLVTGGSTVILT